MEIIIPIAAVSMILVGMLTKFYPPRKINSWYGFRTSLSRKSQEHWDFAQAMSTRLMIVTGGLLMCYWMLFSVIQIRVPYYLELAILVIASIIPILLTQAALKKL